jgi:Co/Zn/Cd efflux system component
VKDKKGKLDEASRMLLEVYIPTFSVSALIGVSIYVTWEAIKVIITPPHDDNVNIYIMYGFAGGNMFIDLLSMFLFWVRGSKVLFQKCVHTFSTDASAPRHVEFLKSEQEREERLHSLHIPVGAMNLNMMSAFTHVTGDTLRTLAIAFSALTASLSEYSGALCDAWAAVIVTVTIFGIVFPLIREIWTAYCKHFEV